MPVGPQHCHVTTALGLCLLICANCLHASIIQDTGPLQGSAAATAAAASSSAANGHKCAGKRPGAKIAGQYVVMFQDEKVDTVTQGISSLRPAFTAPDQAVAAAAAVKRSSSSSSSNEPLPFDIVGTFGAGEGESAGSRRLLARKGKKLLGLVVKVPDTGAGEAVIRRIRSVDTVQYVENDLCVRVAQASTPSQTTYSCVPAAQIAAFAGTTAPGASANWNDPACFAANTGFAWWGEKCGPSGSLIQWAGVYAYDKSSGAVVTNCVKFRPSQATPSADVTYWLGGCGQPPAAAPDLPTRVCLEPFSAAVTAGEQAAAASVQGCIPYGGTVTQTVSMPHPNLDCSTNGMIQMTYTGELCGAANSTSSVPLKWVSAVPTAAAAATISTTTCSTTRVTNPTTAADTLYNKDWFGSCGVPPAKVQYLARGQCLAPPLPPPPPPPSPPPRERTQLPRVPVGSGSQTISAGIKRILAVKQDNNGVLQTVSPVFQSAVAIIDTGVQCNHPDLNVIYTKQWGPENNPDKSKGGGCFDGMGHGTHVSGIIGAINNDLGVIGVMPNTSIVMLKALDSTGSGSTSDLLSAMRWLLETSLDGVHTNDQGQTNAQKLQVSVLSMSLGFYTGSLDSGLGGSVCQVVADLEAAGIVVVAAASNEGKALNNALPAGCPNSVAVTSIAQDDGAINLGNAASSFSNYLSLQNAAGTMPWTPDKMNRTVAAPGNNINSTCSSYAINNQNGYCQFSGTSQAAPHVAGIYMRCFMAGACNSTGGSSNTYLGLQEFNSYNMQNAQYGFQQDPIRISPVASGSCAAGSVGCKYYGYLSWADAF